MIKFFRKIRYDLMEKKQSGKHLKYATGEIILVVLGILIALNINNWNEDRKLKIEERKVIERLIKETKKDIASYKTRVDGINDLLLIYNNFLLVGDSKANDSILNATLLKEFSFVDTWDYESSIVKNNSNTHEFIESDEIQEKLQEVFFIYEYVDKSFSRTNSVKINLGLPLDIKYYKTLNSSDPFSSYSQLEFILVEGEVLGIISNFRMG